MKKLIGLLAIIILSVSQAYASDLELLPTMFSRSNAQDRVWVGSFQLVWNDFVERVVHNPVRFREGTPVLVGDLNKKSFTVDDISDESYYKYVGKVKKNTKRQISRGIRKKLKESSDILDKLDLTPRGDMFILYAMLSKNFEFIKEFDKLGRSAFGDETMAEYFGIDNNSDKTLGSGVKILFYNSPSDYAVKLITTGTDEVYLYKNASNKPFNYIYADMFKKQKFFDGQTEFKKVDELKIPNLSLYEEKVYEELANRRVMGTNIVINQAMQTVKLNLNNKGVKIKSESSLIAEVTSLLPPEELVPRLFYFDDTFVMFIKEKNKKKPYFALRVNDITKFQNN